MSLDCSPRRPERSEGPYGTITEDVAGVRFFAALRVCEFIDRLMRGNRWKKQ
jgi:hypothetical protein